MNYKIVTERPTEGQFVMVWEYQGNIWSETMSWIDGKLTRFDQNEDDWCNPPQVPILGCQVKYVVFDFSK